MEKGRPSDICSIGRKLTFIKIIVGSLSGAAARTGDYNKEKE